MPCVEMCACSSSPSHCATAQCGSSACCTCADVRVLALDDHVGLAHAGLDVAALVLDRILLQPLLGQRLGRVDDEAELAVARVQRCDRGAHRCRVLAREGRHGRARVGGLALEDRPAPLLDVLVRGREHGVHARHRAAPPRRRARPSRVRAASARRRPGACPAARCRRRSARRRRRAAGRSGAGRACRRRSARGRPPRPRGSSSTSTQRSSKRPSISTRRLLQLGHQPRAPRRRAARRARCPGYAPQRQRLPLIARAHLLARRLRVRGQQRRRRDDLAGRAEAALERVLLDERALQRRQRALVAEALDRRDLAAIGLGGEQDAREHRAPVDEHRAGAAGALGAGDLRAREAGLVAQHLRERRALGSACAPLAPVERERDLAHASTVSAWAWLSSRHTRPRPTRSGGAPGTSVSAHWFQTARAQRTSSA